MKQKGFSVSLVVLLITTLAGGGNPVGSQTPTAYFLVANPDLMLIGLSDSYVLPLSDPDDIAFARQLVRGGFRIVSASVTVGSDGINRDMLAPGTPEWSWHVTEFHGFVEAAIELCDGTPTFTEGDAQNWREGEEWDICYWNYTVVAEITDTVPVERSTWGMIKLLFGS
ncbi:MAG: hypothetical protein OEN01_08370 [Candidatus Krumholzibacteria bacterium]|nr:hypothetical protein [Candidatus Krumholzibacteria bacterium]